MHDPNNMLLLLVALPFLAAVAVGCFGGIFGLRSGWIVAGAAAVATYLAWTAAQAQPSPVFHAPWLPTIDVAFALRGDPFGLFFATLVTGIGVLVTLYALAYLPSSDLQRARRFYASLAVFMGAMVGIAVADDLILLFVFWELTSLSSFLLIGHYSENAAAKAGAATALQVTALGGLVMSVGFLLVGQLADTFSLSTMVADPHRIARIIASPLGTVALLLISCGAFTKSAQVPFHFWLPRAMVAPTPVSAYLHAATMVKAGVFLIGRMHPIFGTSPWWLPLLVTVGAATMLFGAYRATQQRDLKAMLAYTTGSSLGAFFLLYGLGGTDIDGFQILNHALYKGALFLVVGIVEHHAHTRSIDQLGGLRRALPLPFVAALLASLSMAGIPPLLGFLGKESFAAVLVNHAVLAQHPVAHWILLGTVTVANALIALTAYRLTAGVFFGPEPCRSPPSQGAAPHHWDALWLSPLLLAGGALLLGLLAAGSFTGRLAEAISSKPDAHVHVALMPHLGTELLLWAATLLLAGVLARLPQFAFDRARGARSIPGAFDLWQAGLTGIATVGEQFSRRWENGSLRWYLAGSAVTLPALLVVAFGMNDASYTAIVVSLQDISWIGLLLCGLLVTAAATAVRAQTRLAAAIASSTVGFVVAMLFVVYRSPDILLTQILIETVSTIFVLLVLVHLPAFPRRDLTPAARFVNGTIAGSVGLAITLLLLIGTTPGIRETDNIATRPGGLLSRSLAEGGGQNAVNVIIVDIRALDTTGEVTVLVVVGLCVYGLLRTRREAA